MKSPTSLAQAVPAGLPERPSPSLFKVSTKPRSPSPNYFALVRDDCADSLTASGAHRARNNWPPPTSAIRSAAARSPQPVSLDDPSFESFRRQSANATFSLGNINLGPATRPASTKRPDAVKRKSSHQASEKKPQQLDSEKPTPVAKPTSERVSPPRPRRVQPAANEEQVSRSPKRSLPIDSPTLFGRPRQESPASFNDSDEHDKGEGAQSLPGSCHQRASLPPLTKQYSGIPLPTRSDTLPSSSDPNTPQLVPPQRVVSLLDSEPREVLLLDLRVQTQYALSRIRGALNLCIPTTLLKRPAFNVQKLAESFKEDEKKAKFNHWQKCKYIVVYDQSSSQAKDAASCLNILKKFASEGWTGCSMIVRGGFTEFSRNFPKFVDKSGDDAAQSPIPSGSGQHPAGAPVIGGCPMPVTKNAANPFFGNIRQNMDLIGGVGQIPIKRPDAMTAQDATKLPTWIRRASDPDDDGKTISDKFLQIEKSEQKRMQEALSSNVSFGEPSKTAGQCVQLAGIEKGQKNRYNNIWPYEHSRVRIQGIPQGHCDYVNGNFLKTPWSNKHYIATQGPIPATFNDFWTVIWQQDVRVIVMLTAETEGGQVKAHNYWSESHYGPFRLSYLSEHRASLEPGSSRQHQDLRPSLPHRTSTYSKPKTPRTPRTDNPFETATKPSSTDHQNFVTIRKFTLTNDSQPFARMREITQLHYSSWPDFGAPADPAHLLSLVEQCDSVIRSTRQEVDAVSDGDPVPEGERPILVHCSAGCGRTGTFCAIDQVMDMVKRQRLSQRHRRTKIRQSTPMDVDQGTPARSSSFFDQVNGETAKEEQQQQQQQQQQTDGSDDWLDRDDIDLVERTVDAFRLQRLSMVQTLRQYVLIYETLLHWLHQRNSQHGPMAA